MFFANNDGGTISFEVTKKGGVVSDVFNSRLVKSSVITQKDAVRIAARFLREKGYENMRHSYQYADGNTLTINYAYVQNGVSAYPTDQGFGRPGNGRIVGFEPGLYYEQPTNHSQ